MNNEELDKAKTLVEKWEKTGLLDGTTIGSMEKAILIEGQQNQPIEEVPMIRGEFHRANQNTHTGRTYPQELLKREIEQYLRDKSRSAADKMVTRWMEEEKK